MREIHNEYQATEDLGGVIVRTVEFVSDPPQKGEGAHRLIHLATITPALQSAR